MNNIVKLRIIIDLCSSIDIYEIMKLNRRQNHRYLNETTSVVSYYLRAVIIGYLYGRHFC